MSVSVQTVHDPECTTLNSNLNTKQIRLIWPHKAFPHQDFLARKVLADQWLIYIKETAHVAFLVWKSDSADGRWLNSWNI